MCSQLERLVCGLEGVEKGEGKRGKKGEKEKMKEKKEKKKKDVSDNKKKDKKDKKERKKEKKKEKKKKENLCSESTEENGSEILIKILTKLKQATDLPDAVIDLPLIKLLVLIARLMRIVLEETDFSSTELSSSTKSITNAGSSQQPREGHDHVLDLVPKYEDETVDSLSDFSKMIEIVSLLVHIMFNLFKCFDDLPFELQAEVVPLVLLRLQLHHILAKTIVTMKSILPHKIIALSGRTLASLFSGDLFLDFRDAAFNGDDWEEEKCLGSFTSRYRRDEIIGTFVQFFNDVLLVEVEKDIKLREIIVALDEVCGWIRSKRV